MKLKEFKPYSLIKAFKKFRYPFSKPREVEAIVMTEEAQLNAASYNLTFLLLHGILILTWYCCVFGFWFYYFIGYCIYWVVATIILNIKEHKNNSHNSDITNTP